MNCYQCGSETEVLSTRVLAGLVVQRRRQCGYCGARFTTKELHEGATRAHWKVSAAFLKAARNRIDLLWKHVGIAKDLPKVGWKSLSEKHAISKSAVYYAAARGKAFLSKVEKVKHAHNRHQR